MRKPTLSLLIRLLCVALVFAMGCKTKPPAPPVFKEQVISKKASEREKKLKEDKIIFSKVPDFMDLECQSCHTGLKYEYIGLEDKKVGPGLDKIASKVNPSWLFRWVQRPGSYRDISRMPCFGFSDEDALADTAYIMHQSDKSYKPPLEYTPASDPEKGKVLFEQLGCMGCHIINGKGGDYAPDLSKIANKMYPRWEYNWLIDPTQYDPQTSMPNFKLSEPEARQIVTYLMTLGKREDIEGLDEKIKSPEVIAQGENIIIRKGCYGCHTINLTQNVVEEASHKDLGIRQLLEKEFGVYRVKKIFEGLVEAKGNNPSQKAPNSKLSDEDYLLTTYKHHSEKTVYLREGLRLIEKYNCRGCHSFDGKGGELAPMLDYEGDRAQTKYIYDFLIAPKRIRPKVVFSAKMPKFNFTKEEVIKLVGFFKAYSNASFTDEIPYEKPPSDDYLIQGRKLVLAFECELCHDEKAPKFSEIKNRLRKSWVKKWLKNTREINPRTKMENHWPKINGKHVVSPLYPKAQKILDGNVDKQIDAVVAYLFHYNEKPFLDIELPEEEDEDEENELM